LPNRTSACTSELAVGSQFAAGSYFELSLQFAIRFLRESRQNGGLFFS